LFLAINKPKSMWQLAKELNKSYGNIHQTIKTLMKMEGVKVEKTRRSSKNPKINVEYYGLTTRGLINLFIINKNSWNYIDQIADQQKDKLLTFQKWSLFKNAGLKEELIRYFQSSIESLVLFYATKSMLNISVSFRNEEDGKTAIDATTLFIPLLAPEQKRNEAWAKLCKQDEELRQFVDSQFRREEQEYQRIHTIKTWWTNL